MELQPDPCINLSSLGILPSKLPRVLQSSLGSYCTAVWSGAVEGQIPDIHGSLACDCSMQSVFLNNTGAFAGVELQDLHPFHRKGWGFALLDMGPDGRVPFPKYLCRGGKS